MLVFLVARCSVFSPLSFFCTAAQERASRGRSKRKKKKNRKRAYRKKANEMRERRRRLFFFFFASLSSRDNVLKKSVEIFSLFFRPPPPLSLLSSSIFYALRALAECSFSFFRFSSLFVNSTRFVNGSSSCSKKKQVAGRVAFERRAVEQGKAASFLASSSRWGRSPPPPPQL